MPHRVDTGVILAMVLANAVIGFLQDGALGGIGLTAKTPARPQGRAAALGLVPQACRVHCVRVEETGFCPAP
jgi:hypothetical protein